MLLSNLEPGRIEAGCDEAGRGCIAGPVVAAAVILPETFHHPLSDLRGGRSRAGQSPAENALKGNLAVHCRVGWACFHQRAPKDSETTDPLQERGRAPMKYLSLNTN